MKASRLVTLSALIVVILTVAALADVPQTINYQGYLKNADGTPVNTAVRMFFGLYSKSSGNNPVWYEYQDITPQNGIYSVLLGSSTPLNPLLLSDSDYVLSVIPDGGEELLPRQPIASVPFAMQARTLSTQGLKDMNIRFGTPSASNPTRRQVATESWDQIRSGNLTVTGIGHPRAMVFDGTHLYVADEYFNTVVKLDPATGKDLATFPIDGTPIALAYDGVDSIWVANTGTNRVMKINPESGVVTYPFLPVTAVVPTALASDGDFIWAAESAAFHKIDPATGSVTTYTAATNVTAMRVVASALYTVRGPNLCAHDLYSAYISCDPQISGTDLSALAFDGKYLWIADKGGNSIIKADAFSTNSYIGTYAVGAAPSALAFDGSSIWVANSGSDNVMKINPINGEVIGTYAAGISPDALAFDGNSIWVASRYSVMKLSNAGIPVGVMSVGSAQLLDNAVNANAIADSSVTDAKIATVSGSKVTGNISGSAANVTGTVAVANGGTGASTAAAARTSLAVPGLTVANTFTTGTQTIQTGTAATRGLIVQGAASQSANLQEWQDSAGVAVASVSPAGVFSGNGSGLTGLNASSVSSGVLLVSRGGTGSATQNFVDLSSTQGPIGGNKTFTGSVAAAQLTSSGNIDLTTTAGQITQNGSPLIHTTGGVTNFFAGTYAGNLTTNSFSNTASGYLALSNITTGGGNTASGAQALYGNTTGRYNVAVGTDALRSQTFNNGNTVWDSWNTAVGNEALYSNQPTGATNGIKNTALGAASMRANTTGYANTAGGFWALRENTTGTYNTSLGYYAGNNGPQSNVTGSYNTFIGAFARPLTSALTNASAIGYNAVVSQSNSLVLGDTGVGAVKVGIGTQSPAATLTVVNSAAATKGLSVQGATSQSANLQEWQNSAGTVLASVSSAGVVSLPSNGLAVGTNQLVVSGGHVGIGKSPGSDFLDLAGTMRMNDSQIYLRGSGDTLHGVGWYTADGFVSGSKDGPVVYGCGGGTLGSTCGGNRAALTWDNASNVNLSGTLGVASIPTGTTSNYLCSSGANSGTLQRCGSSRRLKDKIADLPFGLDTVIKLRPVSFTWKANGNEDFGFIAEEVAELNPVFAIYNEQGEPDGVKYANMSAVLVKAVQEQQQEIERQKVRMDVQNTVIEQLKAELEALKRSLVGK